jgi:hypothetical protein
MTSGSSELRAFMKTASAIVIVVVALVSLGYAGKKPAITQENLAKLQTVKTIFVDGTSESADKLREKLETFSCFTLSNNKSRADAIMTTEERNAHDSVTNEVLTSVTITMPNGDQVWTRSKKGGGFVHSGAGMAAEDILHDLAKEACPNWKGWKRKSN